MNDFFYCSDFTDKSRLFYLGTGQNGSYAVLAHAKGMHPQLQQYVFYIRMTVSVLFQLYDNAVLKARLQPSPKVFEFKIRVDSQPFTFRLVNQGDATE